MHGSFCYVGSADYCEKSLQAIVQFSSELIKKNLLNHSDTKSWDVTDFFKEHTALDIIKLFIKRRYVNLRSHNSTIAVTRNARQTDLQVNFIARALRRHYNRGLSQISPSCFIETRLNHSKNQRMSCVIETQLIRWFIRSDSVREDNTHDMCISITMILSAFRVYIYN